MTKPLLTIGFACIGDYYGVHETVQGLRIYHRDVMDQVEIVAVDSSPDNEHGQHVRGLFVHLDAAGQACQYIPFKGESGTAQPRNEVFKRARGEFVFCMDAHVLFDSDPRHPPHTIRRLLDWCKANPDNRDLLTGPLVYDGMGNFSTHFNDVWRHSMWGTWGLAWQCPCGFTFAVQDAPDNRCRFVSLVQQLPDHACAKCGKPYPSIGFAGHEKELEKLGYKMLGKNRDDEPFEIPACGLGLFGCRADSWLGFSDKFRGFGGEEWYIHEKYRAAGRRCLSLPFLRWNHRFGWPGGQPGIRSPWLQIRNYVIGHAELGLPLDRVKEHFVKTSPDDATHAMPVSEWDQLAANPSDPIAWPTGPNVLPPPCGSGGPCGGSKDAAQPVSVMLTTAGIDLAAHAAKLAELSEGKSVVYLSQNPAMPLCDLLIIDNCRTGAAFDRIMSRHAYFGKRVAILGTVVYANRGEDGAPGLMVALRNFLHHEREWTAIYANNAGAGIIVISKDEADKHQPPSLLRQALNFTKSLAAHAKAGLKVVDDETLAARLDVCMVCPHRNVDICGVCGCGVESKCGWAEQSCPDKPPRWPAALPMATPAKAG